MSIPSLLALYPKEKANNRSDAGVKKTARETHQKRQHVGYQHMPSFCARSGLYAVRSGTHCRSATFTFPLHRLMARIDQHPGRVPHQTFSSRSSPFYIADTGMHRRTTSGSARRSARPGASPGGREKRSATSTNLLSPMFVLLANSKVGAGRTLGKIHGLKKPPHHVSTNRMLEAIWTTSNTSDHRPPPRG